MAWEWLGPVSTAVVGLAGIGGTVWTAGKARGTQYELTRAQALAESARTQRTDKRALYAKVLHELHGGHTMARNVWSLTAFRADFSDDLTCLKDGDPLPEDARVELKSLPGDLRELRSAFGSLQVDLMKLSAELTVVAGPRMGLLVTCCLTSIQAVAKGDIEAATETIHDVSYAMHLDLDPTSDGEAEIDAIEDKVKSQALGLVSQLSPAKHQPTTHP